MDSSPLARIALWNQEKEDIRVPFLGTFPDYSSQRLGWGLDFGPNQEILFENRVLQFLNIIGRCSWESEESVQLYFLTSSSSSL